MTISPWEEAPSTTAMALSIKETYRDPVSTALASCGTKQASFSMRACGRIIDLMAKG